MRVASLLLTLALVMSPSPGWGDEPELPPTPAEQLAHKIATYVPNRIFDLLDIVRLRVRFGPGAASNFRITRAIAATPGSYSAFYVGLHGPRGQKGFPSPIGFEELNWETDPRSARAAKEPYYGPLEVGAGFQLVSPGLDVGVEPLEAIDFAAGLLFIDFRGDDY